MTDLKPHPIAECFPKMNKEDFAKMVASIKAHGMADPIWLYEGMILDGRHRYHGCLKAGTGFRTREYAGDDPIGFARSLNHDRRHETASERAMSAARLAALPAGRNPAPVTLKDAAKAVQVSERTAQQAAAVIASGDKAVIAKVDAKKITVNAAEKIIKEKAKPAPPATLNKFQEADAKAERLREIMRGTSKLKTELLAIGQTPIGKFLNAQEIQRHTSGLFETIKFAVPHAECGYCGGKGEKTCKACRGGGWVTKLIEAATPPELKR